MYRPRDWVDEVNDQWRDLFRRIRSWFRDGEEAYYRDIALFLGHTNEVEDEPTEWYVDFHDGMTAAEWAKHLRLPDRGWVNWLFENGELYLQDAPGRAFVAEGVELDQHFADGRIKIKHCYIDQIKLTEVK